MKKIISIIALLMLVVVASAQNMSVASFKSLLHDQSANLQGTMKIDQNGEVCAIIKVQTTAMGFSFDVGSLGIVATEQKVGEIWVYVPHGVRRITISHQTLGVLRDYSFPCTIEAARTYLLVLTTGTVHTVVEEAVTQQYVMFDVQPQNAMVEINDQILEVRGGTATKRLPFGKYNYRVQASRYYPEVGMVTVNDPNNKHVVKVQLKPAYSSFTFKSSDPQAQIWVNGEQKGIGLWTGEMEYESVLLECKRENHRATRKEITLDAAMAQNPIQLDAPSPIYGSLDINSSPAGATVFIDDTKVGETPMFISKQIIGQHKVRITRSGYGDYNGTINVTEGQTATVEGRLADAVNVRFTSNVPDATLYVDGVAVGKSAGTYSIGFGQHTLAVNAEDYEPYSESINVEQGTTSFAINAPSKRYRVFTVKGVSFTMVAVDGGTFTMGATSEMAEPYSDEKPTHQVTLSSYSIGETEVTQALWEAVMGRNPSNFDGVNRPVEMVSWNDCQTFIQKLNKLTKQKFRLPTEAEWEYAARGGNKSRHTQYSGSSDINAVAWYYSNSERTTHAVKTKQPNELGIYDMSGNVSEWCNDWCGNYSSSAQTNPTGHSSGPYRMFRGGGFGSFVRGCRSSDRGSRGPDFRDSYLGLRLAL